MKYEYEGEFLRQFEEARISLIVNQFCYAVRAGNETAAEVLAWVTEDAIQRLKREGDAHQHQSQRTLLKAIDSDEARLFAEHIIWRESLPYEERQKLKEAAGINYKYEWMKKHPPTDKQLKYLEALACHVIPANRWEASNLINEYKTSVSHSRS